MKLASWIENEVDSEELLPLCHTTRWEYFEKILDDKNLANNHSKFPDPNPQSWPEDKLVYLFYGLPFYIYETGDGEEINTEVTNNLPIGLIFKPELATFVDRFYPFDTGAFFSNSYKNIFDLQGIEELKIYEVSITDGKEMKKLVKRYYDNNENYCFGKNNGFNSSKTHKEEKLLRLFKFSNNNRIDPRIKAVEVHSLNSIGIKQNLMAVVMPRLRSEKDKYLIDKIETNYPNVKIEYYNELTRYSSQSIRSLVLNATMKYYKREHPTKFFYGNIK
jgi:hypothetical protein